MTFWQSSSPALTSNESSTAAAVWHRDDKDVFLPQHIYKNKFWDFFLCPMYAKNIIQFFHLKHKCNLNKEKIEISNNEKFFQITSMSMSNVPKSWICFEKMTLAALLDQSSNFTLFQKKCQVFFYKSDFILS